MVILNDKYMRDSIDMTSFKFGGKIKVLGYITNKITTDTNDSTNISPLAQVGIGLNQIMLVAFVTQKIGNAASQDEMITMALQVIVLVLLTFSLIFSLTPIIKDILYRDYNKYNDFIYDLRQIKLFYSKKNATYSNLI